MREPLLQQYRDQFTPYENVLGCQISSGRFDGTLFRLPLRKWPSKISIKPYTAGKVNSLFESFMEEAPVILLFLKNVESISIYETTWTEREKRIFTVKIKEELRDSIREEKLKFVDMATEFLTKPYEMSYETTVEIDRPGKHSSQSRYIVLNRVGHENLRLAELSSTLRMIPWAGVAATLDVPLENTRTRNGRVFCYLPLPTESDCKTGLPVHVHGAFGLTDNRRNLKWPGPESQIDDAAEWNLLLTRDVVSKAYASLIVTLTQMKYPREQMLPFVHSIWPDLDLVQSHWKFLLKPFFAELIDKAVFWTPSLGGRWIALEEGILDRLDRSPNKVREELRDVVVGTLLQADKPVISPPYQAMKAIDQYVQHHDRRPMEITPSYVRAVLKENVQLSETNDLYVEKDAIFHRGVTDAHLGFHSLKGMEKEIGRDLSGNKGLNVERLSKREKLLLLEYILLDRNFSELSGLPLLPLADETFQKFRDDIHEYSPEHSVLIASRSHPRSLIPGRGSKFLDEKVGAALVDTLCSVAGDIERKYTGPTQLVRLSPSLVPKLLRESLPDVWRKSSVVVPWSDTDETLPDDLWLRGLWTWLKSEFPKDLSPFEGIPLIPLADGRSDKRQLIKLKHDHRVIQSSSYFASLPRTVANALQKAGCIVLHHLAPFCDHPALKYYMEPPTPSGVLKVLATGFNEAGNDYLISCSVDEKLTIRAFLSSLRNPSDDEVLALMTLPIFQTLDGTTFTSVQPGRPLTGTKLDVAPPRLHLPSGTKIPNAKQILSAADDDSYQLLRRLPVRILNTSSFLIDKVFPYVESGTFYSREQVSDLMFWVIQRLPALSSDNKSFPDHLKTVRFVPVSNGSLKPPCELYDPEDELIQKLFEGESDLFPAEEFAKAHTLSLLRVFLGLRRSRFLEAKDVLLIAKQITQAPEGSALRRAEALTQFLKDNSYLAEHEVHLEESAGLVKRVSLGSVLSSLPWLPAAPERLSKYPSRMPWFGVARRLYCPKDMRDADMVNIIGSSMPVLRESLDEKLKKAFGWSFPPPISYVVDQLKGAISWHQQEFKSSEMELLKFRAMLKDIYSHLSSEMVIDEAFLVLKEYSSLSWMWHGSGFARPSCVALKNECQLELRPYMFVLSDDFQKYSSLFKRCGLLETLNDTSALNALYMIRDWHQEKKRSMEEVNRDLRVARDVLDYLTRDGTPLPPEIRKNVLTPIQTEDDVLILQPCCDVSFCDAEWLRLGNSDSDITEVGLMVHKCISTETAQLLGIPPLSRHLAVTETLGFQQSGPHEPVTTRLKNILMDHSDDLAIFKELIQNADDAGAKEVKFLLDWRKNNAEKLLCPGLAEAQGPALWVYNDACFKDKDFENINKLAGATKVGNEDKLGRFGLGFSTVYNITDLPSFISREFIAFFDPQTAYLGDLITDKSRPGIRLNLKRNPKVVIAFPDQFKPYQGIFGCTFENDEEHFFYDGTLFRFPLRTMRQASESEICSKYYDENYFACLISAFQENATKMMLFLKNISTISFSQISAYQNPSSANRLFEVTKETLETFSRRDLARKDKNNNHKEVPSSDLNEMSNFDEQYDECPSLSKLVSFKFQTYPRDTTQNANMQTCRTWLITSCYGDRKSLEMANSEDGKLNGLIPKAEVATLLSSSNKSNGQWSPEKIVGEVFFGLPLGVETGSPVHVNGCFAVTANRQNLWEDTGGGTYSQKPIEVLWNEYLLEDAASKAYVQLLEEIATLREQGKAMDLSFDAIWPDPEKAPSKTWKTFAYSVYEKICSSSVPLVKTQLRWVSIKDSVFLDENVMMLPESLPIMWTCGYNVVQLPRFVSVAFQKCVPSIVEQTVTLERFVCDVFFPNIASLPRDLRDPVTCHVLDEFFRGARKFEKPLKQTKCIPTSPMGIQLSRPADLIDPTGAVSTLFLDEEPVFPNGTSFFRPERRAALKKLGMVDNLIAWEGICERAIFISSLANEDTQKASLLSRNLLKYLNNNMCKLSPPNTTQRKLLSEIRFLPVMDKPTEYCLPWRGAEGRETNFLCARELCREDSKYLLGSVKPFLDESPETGCDRLTKDVAKLLGFANQHATMENVLLQLQYAVHGLVACDAANRECTRNVCIAVYQFLQDRINTSDRQVLLDQLNKQPWIFVDNKFVTSSQVAFSWHYHGDPFLYCLPEEFTLKFKELFKALGVRESFCSQDLVDKLFMFEETKQGKPLTPQEFRTVKTFLEEIVLMDDEVLDSYFGHLPLPDVNLVLTTAGDLAINDSPWIHHEEQMKCLHSDISPTLAHRFGAQTIREQKLDKYSHTIGRPFGQSERLTHRIKTVLESYPCDAGILKEIIQNADDAGAREVHFVHDPRQHGTTRILSEKWKDLQGPALCIYNDCAFTESDMEGIQRLGIGSKVESPEKTGKYGIGFNAVYHVTDCPSFITNGDVLCVLDPHARYAPDATTEFPGRRFEPLDNEFWNHFADLRPGYLEEFFELKNSTLFRLPIRTDSQATRSEISSKCFSNSDIDHLLTIFEGEIRDILLFLQSVKKISISRIENNRLVRRYEATATIQRADLSKVRALDAEIMRCRGLKANCIPWFGTTYTITIQDTLGRREGWVVQQCLGSRMYGEKTLIPEGSDYGLLPRASVAARVVTNEGLSPSRRKRSLNSPPQTSQNSKIYRAFCSLPLPIETGLPVHVNGHFVLDRSRRNLWKDEGGHGQRTQWNEFIKNHVLAPAYAELIEAARNHVPGISEGIHWHFSDIKDATSGLKWYHGLFPDLKSIHSEWKGIALTVYKLLANSNQTVLPIIRSEPPLTNIVASPLRFSMYGTNSQCNCLWVPPCSDKDDQEAFFSVPSDPDLEELLLKVGLPIVHVPPKLYYNFKEAGAIVKTVSPDIVLAYLAKTRHSMLALPCSIKKTTFKDASDLKRLVQFCMEDENFLQRLNGLPLLLTDDEVLREFDHKNPVFLTPFSSLVPSQPDLFVNKEFIPLFAKYSTNQLCKAGVFKRFDTKSVEPFLIQILPSRWFACDRHVSWEPSEAVLPSAEWLTTLWELIVNTYQERQSNFEDNEDASETLRPLDDWPILPTSKGTLAPLSLGKTVLDLSSRIHDDDRMVRILCKLGSSQIDFSVLTMATREEASVIVSSYLAKPYSRQDVISVLHYLSKEDNFHCDLSQREITTLLRFLQEDVTTVYSNQSLLKKLPLYKTLNGRLVSLDSYTFSYVVDLPQCVPLAEVEDRIEEDSCVLLEAIQEIEPLYKALDITFLSQVEVFVKYILPNLDVMSSSSIKVILTYIRDTLLVTLKNTRERTTLLETLRETNIFPGDGGTLFPASKFYDPENAVFKAMLPLGDFPPEEYRLSHWLPMLRQIGLKQTVTQQQFIEFTEDLASEATTRFKDPLIQDKSKTLVTCLFQQDDLHDPSFLHIVSSIKFVAAEVAAIELRKLQPQFGCPSIEDVPPFTEFHGALPSEQQRLAWTCMPLLPAWATPQTAEKQLLEDLGVSPLPPLDKVINHVNFLTKAHSGNVHKDTPKEQRELLHDVIYESFSFMKSECNCPGTALSERCTKSCLAIETILRKIPCIPVEEGRVFVQGSQLAFETTIELAPYFYKVPREYGHFEHLIKRLGATEKPTPSQFADILGRLKEVCQDKHMEPNEKRVAREATHGFFTTLSLLVKEKSEEAAARRLVSLNELYLPSKEGFLKQSNELIFHDCPSFERRARDFAGDFVDISREGELTADRLSYLLSLLPLRLRAKTIQHLLREEIHPSCRDKHCIADSALGSNDSCPFVNRYRNVLLSPKLVNGILRVIRHQRQTPNLPQEVKDQVQVLCSSLSVTCMASLDTHLVLLESGRSLKDSNETQDCFLEEQNGQWELFIRHGTDENPLHIQLCFQVNRLIRNQIEKEIYLQAMLACRVPDEILPSLDRCGVAQDLMGSEARTTEPVLGSEIPVMYHYLLRQDIEYFFRQGEIVGYEREHRTEDGEIDDSEPLYVYAKVVRKVPNRKRSMGTSKFDFQAKYRIDIGEPRLVEVSVLDLYKFDRSVKEVPTVPIELSDSLEVTLFTGDPNNTEHKSATRNERLERARREIKDTLWEAWKLPENERRKVIKRLFLRWHPDKNVGCDIANDVMQFLLNEIERMEKLFPSSWRENVRDAKDQGQSNGGGGFNDFFNQWNQRARQERQTYNTFKRQAHQGTPYAKRSTNPQRNEAKRWLKQAKEDLTAARNMHAQEATFSALVCFLCQQATEKVFKSALYAACGISESQLETHDVLNLAYEITELDGSPEDIPVLAAKLKNYYEQTRYPHYHRGDVIPSDAFTFEQAQDALEIAESLMDKITQFVNDSFAQVS